MFRFTKVTILTLALLLAWGGGSSLFAQTTTGRIVGTVADQTGALIPGVEVMVRNPGTGLTRTVITNESGTYIVPVLPPAVYQVEATLPGFRREVRSGVTVSVDAAIRLDFTLAVGQVTEVVEVTADAPLLQSESASLGQVIDSRKVTAIPLNRRHFMSLTVLTTGVFPVAEGSNLSTQNFSFHANGGREHDNNFLLDGIDNNDTGNKQLVIVPSIDAIQEFKIQTHAYAAEFGAASGGVLNVQTKSGTNEFHVTAFEFLRNDVLDARNFFAVEKPPYKRNQYGVVVTGPILRDKMFFMFNYEANRIRRLDTRLASVPTAKQHAGDFSELGKPLIDPFTGQAFPGNIIPSDRFDPITANITQFWPLPNRPLSSGSNYLSTANSITDFDILMGKVDYRVSDKQNIFVRIAWQDAYRLDPRFDRGSQLPNTGTAYFQPIGRNVAINDTYVFGPRVVNEFRAGFNRLIGCTCPPWLSRDQKSSDQNWAQELGFKGVQNVIKPDVKKRSFGWPRIDMTGYAGITGGSGSERYDNTWHFYDALALTRGNHQLKMGGEFRTQYFHYDGRSDPNGRFRFDGRYSGDAWADLLLGYPSRTIRAIGDVQTYTKGRAVNLFFQDDWKVTPNLTLNLGLRWEIMTPYADDTAGQAVFDVPTAQIVIVGKSGPQTFPHPFNPDEVITLNGSLDVGRKNLYNHDFNNFVPRTGFAYSPEAVDLVLRGGFGVFTVPDFNRHAFRFRNAAYPWVIPQTFFGARTVPDLTMTDPFPEALGRNSIQTYAMDPNYRNGYTMQFVLGIQRPLGANMVLDVSYAGSRGLKWFGDRNINQARLGPGSVGSRRPIPGWGSITHYERSFASKFHSLQAKFERRFSDGLTFVSAYTWSHAITDQDEGASGVQRDPQDSNNLAAEWGNANFDRRHRLVNSFSYELPIGEGKRFMSSLPGVAQFLLGGWQVAGITTMSTGSSFTPEVGGDISRTGLNFVRPNRICDGILPRGERSPDRWFDTSCFKIPEIGTFGNAGRGILKAPGINNWDISLTKRNQIGEDHSIDFRVEFFNAFNHPGFNLPSYRVNSRQFGTLTRAREARQIQFGLKINY